MPLENEPHNYQQICAHIGHLTLKWALAESTLDTIVFLAHGAYGGHAIAEIPRSFRLKPPYLRKVFGSKPEYAEYLRAIEPLLVEAADIAQQRHRIIHGVLVMGSDGQIIQHQYRADRKGPHKQAVSIKRMSQLAVRCSTLALNLIIFTCEPLGVMAEDALRDIRSQFKG